MIRQAALALTLVTGFSGLAYEVAWQRYLTTLLGVHSEATSAVLAIFLGGLSLGYWGFGLATRRWVERSIGTGRPPPLLRNYGVVEAAIGVYALLFPWLFRAAQEVSLWLPTGGGLLAFAADLALATALIAPPAILMGGTIPVLTQALARDLEDATRLHALVYALNTLGATAGALAAGFVLVPWLGLDGVARAMGVVNLAAGAAFVALGGRAGRRSAWRAGDREVAALAAAREAKRRTPESGGGGIYVAAALLIGFAAMTCQTVLIRVSGLALGPSEFTFAMIVACIVLAIGLGSLAVSAAPRIPRGALSATLWAATLAFGILYLHVDDAPYWGHVLRSFFTSQEEAFLVFYGAAFLATLIVIGPAVALTGAALPLLFDAVREEMGELGSKAGRLYCQNTIGSLFGALAGGYALLFWLDLHHVFRLALGLLALAAALVTAQRHLPRPALATALLFAPLAVGVAWLPAWNPAQLASGLFRTRAAQPWTHRGPDAMPLHEVAFYEDDPTCSVAALTGGRGPGKNASIVVNGKSDGNTRTDLHTMSLAALLPALFAERPERAFVIGYGTGITAGVLAELDEVREVTVAEISGGVLRAAPIFDFANHGASRHPKLVRVRTDAYRALRRSEMRYDVIVSEPSNPWVAGIEMLFSREFLEAVRERLTPGGVFAQWFHVYETNQGAIELVLGTYSGVFDHVGAWHSQAGDVLLLGTLDARHAFDLDRLERRTRRPDFAAALGRLGIETLPELLAHEVMPVGVLGARPPTGSPSHTLYHPRLSFRAGRGFFAGRPGRLPFPGLGDSARIGERHALLARHLGRYGENVPESVWTDLIEHACALRLPHCALLIAASARGATGPAVQERIALARRHGAEHLDAIPLMRFFLGEQDDLALAAAGGRPPAVQEQSRSFLQRYLAALPFRPETLVRLWERCRPARARDPRCRDGLRQAHRLVEGGSLPASWAELAAAPAPH